LVVATAGILAVGEDAGAAGGRAVGDMEDESAGAERDRHLMDGSLDAGWTA
jgi:hypothetical protein